MVASLLRKCVDRYEQLLDYESAAFYAERWSVEEASEEARTCLARLYFRRHKIKQAYLILQGATSDDARYLLALCCVRLGLLREAEQALLSDSFNMPGNVGEVPGGAAGLFLLGCIYRKQHRKETAIEYLKRSLAEDPFMWSAVIELSEMGADFDLAVHHGMTVDVAGDFFSEQKINRNAVPLAVPEESRRERPLSLETVPQLSGSSSRKSLPHTAHLGLSSLSMRLPLPSPGSASPMRINSVPDSGVSSEHHVPARLYFDTPGLTPISSTSGGPGSSSRSQLQVNRALEFGRSTGAQTNTFSVLNTHSSKEDAPYSEPLSTRVGRRVSFGPTARLSFSSVPGVLDDLDDLEDAYTNPLKVQRTADVEIEAPSVMNEYRSKLRSYASEARDSRPPRGRRSVDGRTDRDAAEIREDDIEGVAALLLIFAEALKQLHRNDAPACIGWLQCLPLKQYCTGHVHHLLGLAYFNMSDYKACMHSLREMLRLEPHRVRGLEILSTALWHLKRDTDLASLAQQSVEVDRLCPEVWCVVGNCFSLQREHSTAVRFFERALQLAPDFVYAHTLCGHEHFANESYDKAIASFRQALRCDERHFNAWYGLGVVFFRQERLDLAEYHFRRARCLNPCSSVLSCYLGMVLHTSGDVRRRREALVLLTRACERDSRNPQLHFQLAHMLVAADRLEDALDKLQLVRELAPREPPVFSLLGTVCHRLGQRGAAVGFFNTAVALDPKELAIMKAAYETFPVGDVNQEEEE